jgi:hypothetical protein
MLRGLLKIQGEIKTCEAIKFVKKSKQQYLWSDVDRINWRILGFPDFYWPHMKTMGLFSEEKGKVLMHLKDLKQNHREKRIYVFFMD